MKKSNKTIIILATIISVLVVFLLGFVTVTFLRTPDILDVSSENSIYQSQIAQSDTSKIDGDTVSTFTSSSSSSGNNKVHNDTNASTTSKSDNAFKAATQGLGNVLTGTVELNISKELLELDGEEFNYTLTKEQKDNGFINVKKNNDGSATFTIKRKDYKRFISELRATAKQGINELTEDGSFASVKSITYNDNLSKITITANKDSFENGFDSLVVFSCGLSSMMYQMFDVDAPGKCTVEVKDSATGKVFQTTVYPDALDD